MRAELLVIVSCLAAASAWPEPSKGRLVGSVTSVDGSRLPGAEIVLVRPGKGALARLSTGSLGTYRSPDLDPAVLDVRVSLAGFAAKTLANVEVRKGVETQLDVTLEVATFEESVKVVGEAPRATLEGSQLREISPEFLKVSPWEESAG